MESSAEKFLSINEAIERLLPKREKPVPHFYEDEKEKDSLFVITGWDDEEEACRNNAQADFALDMLFKALTLSGPALKVLLELFTRFNGKNNGQLCLSYADAAKKLGLGHATIRRAFDELQVKGFIGLHKKGYWYGRKASEWLITNKSYQGFPPTNDWKQWRGAACKQQRKTEAGFSTEHIPA